MSKEAARNLKSVNNHFSVYDPFMNTSVHPLSSTFQLSISQSEWVRLAREVIVNTLFEKSGLQLKLTLSKHGDKVS